jgi:hypothetical protein
MNRKKGIAVISIIILILIVAGGGILAYFFWPKPIPKISISDLSPQPRNGERLYYDDPMTFYWEAYYSNPGDPVYADFYLGESENDLELIQKGILGDPTYASEGIFTFEYEMNLSPHKQYWWTVKVKNEDGKFEEVNPWTFTLKNDQPSKSDILFPQPNETNVALANEELSWIKSTDADNDVILYDIYFGESPNLSDSSLVVTNWNKNTLPFEKLPKLNFSTKYYWRVVATDGQKESSSITSSFTTESVQPLPRPVKGNPGFTEKIVDPSIETLNWELSNRYYSPVVYKIYFSDAENDPVFYDSATSTLINSPELEAHTSYKWKVEIEDLESGEIKSSDVWEFSTLNRNPTINIIEQKDEIIEGMKNIYLTWSTEDEDDDEVNISAYLVYPDGEETILFENENRNNLIIEDLDKGKNYTIKLIAKDAYGAKTTKEVDYYSGNLPPRIELLEPINNAEVTPYNVKFVWEGSDPEGDSINYTLVITDISSGEKNQRNTYENTYLFVNLKPNREYEWYVIGKDSNDAKDQSETIKLTTEESTPDGAILVSPENGAIDVPVGEIEFSWMNLQENANPKYQLLIAENSDFIGARVYNSNKTSLKVSDAVKNQNTKYFWKVISIDGNDRVESEPSYFMSYNAPPKIPELISPENGSNEVDGKNVELFWRNFDEDSQDLISNVYIMDENGDIIKKEMLNSNGENKLILSEPLKSNSTYKWWVGVEDENRAEKISEEYSFKTIKEPVEIIFDSEKNLTLSSLPYILKWKIINASDAAEIQIFFVQEGKEESEPALSGKDIESFQIGQNIRSLNTDYNYDFYIKVIDEGNTYESEKIKIEFEEEKIKYTQPENGSLFNTENPFKWEYLGFSTPISYTFILYDNEDNLIDRVEIEGNKNSFVYNGALKNGTEYKWAMEVYDGNISQGPVYSFRTTEKPLQFISQNPSNNSDEIKTSDLTLSWTLANSSEDITYDLFFENMTSPIAQDIRTNSYKLDKALKGNTMYSWRVMAKSNGDTILSPIWSFRTVNSRPVINIISPDDNVINVKNSITLSWTGSDVDNDNLTYKILLGNSVSELRIVGNTSSNTYTLSDLQAGRDYYWSIEISDGKYYIESPVRKFTTEEILNYSIDARTPDENGILVYPIYQWDSNIGNNVQYSLYLGDSPNSMVKLATTSNKYFETKNVLERNKNYFWQVIAEDANGNEVKSEIKNFSTTKYLYNLPILSNGSPIIANFNSTNSLPDLKKITDKNYSIKPVINGNYVYLVDDYGEISTYLYSDSDMKLLNTFNVRSGPVKMNYADDCLWILDSVGSGSIKKVYLENGMPHSFETIIQTDSAPSDFAITENADAIVTADSFFGIRIFVRTSNDSYSERGSSSRERENLDGFINCIQIRDNMIFAGESGREGGLKYINLDSFTKESVGNYFIVDILEKFNSYLFAVTDSGISIINIFNPASINILSEIEFSDNIYSLSADENFLYIDTQSGDRFYNISNIKRPVLIN